MVVKTINIDLNSKEYLNLHPYRLNNIIIREEKLEKNKYYVTGILPGMKPIPGSNYMYCKVRSLKNFIEHSKITTEDVKKINNENFLLMKFFHKREIAWKNRKLIKKKGETLAYYMDGYIYNEKQFLNTIRDLLKNIYKDLKHLHPELIKMKRKYGRDFKIKITNNFDDELRRIGFAEMLQEIFDLS